jgi:hypothetical protein
MEMGTSLIETARRTQKQIAYCDRDPVAGAAYHF